MFKRRKKKYLSYNADKYLRNKKNTFNNIGIKNLLLALYLLLLDLLAYRIGL